MVAASAIIPMFAFPEYNYPNLREILIYPNSFDEKFQTQRFEGHKESIIGRAGLI
jgi:Mlc titration factor MtfA (ptsG expression regulator)